MNEKYKTIRKIGEGSYGTVYLVEDSQGKQYALKDIQVNPFTKQESKEEVEALKLLDHRNFIKIYDYAETQQNLKILTQFCQGSTLKELCRDNWIKLDIEEILSLAEQIIDAAVYMNQRGIVHRDLKPQNIMLELNGKPTIKICDFGCAKRSSILTDISQEISSSFEKGTASYTSPQQLDNQNYSSKCDVWSMGCLLYEMMFGHHPYKSQSIKQMKQKIKQSEGSQLLEIPEDTNLLAKTLLHFTLKYNEQERASWKQLKLLKKFMSYSANKTKFLQYLKEIMLVGEWIFSEVWDSRYELDINKDLKRGFIFFVGGLIYELSLLIKGMINKDNQFDYLGSIQNDGNYETLEREINKKSEQYKNIYIKIRTHIQKSERLKKLLKKVPSKRNATIPNLQYTIKYGNKVLKQIINSRNATDIINHSKIIYVLTKWVKFEEYFTLNNYMKIDEINSGVIVDNNINWIKQQLNVI